MSQPSATTVINSFQKNVTSRPSSRSSTPIGGISLRGHTPLAEETKPISRGPCPALNTLANHGYLPYDGHNISAEDLLKALQHPDTYKLSARLAHFLVHGGRALLRRPLPISLHELGEHDRIEHDASVVHKNTGLGHKHAPVRCDTILLDGLLGDKEFLTVDDIAKRRAELEKASKLGALHGEIARGEWALVMDIFGREHGGHVPCDFLRIWLKENRFPKGWRPTHEQGFVGTVKKSFEIREKMKQYEKIIDEGECSLVEPILAEELRSTPEVEDVVPGSVGPLAPLATPPDKRQKTVQDDT